MNILRLVTALAASLVIVGSANAQDDAWRSNYLDPVDTDSYLGQVSSVYISVSDDVVDGCWTGISAATTAIEIGLRRAGIAISDDFLEASHSYVVIVSGYKNGTLCVGSIGLSLVRPILAENTLSGGQGAYWSTGIYASSLISGSDLNDLVRDYTVQLTDSLALRILRAQE